MSAFLYQIIISLMDTQEILLAENIHGTGAVKDTPDPRDYIFGQDVGGGTPPFDWTIGFDIESELKKILGNDAFKIPVKDQNGSFSCGGQAWSYLWSVLFARFHKTFEEKSAKFIYSQTFVGTGGSAGRTNCQLVMSKGVSSETLCPSYDEGNAPGEAFMERKSDISDAAFAEGKQDIAIGYANVSPDIDLVAQAMRDMFGTIIGIDGSNNGTWRSAYPIPPVPGIPASGLWAHWLFIGKAKLINGKKYVAVLNSWNQTTGDLGWQWISEDYFTNIAAGTKSIWSAWTMIFNTHPDQLPLFTRSLMLGSKGDDVKEMQEILGFTGNNIDGIFGRNTLGAVKKFQLKNDLNADGIVGPMTQAALLEAKNK